MKKHLVFIPLFFALSAAAISAHDGPHDFYPTCAEKTMCCVTLGALAYQTTNPWTWAALLVTNVTVGSISECQRDAQREVLTMKKNN